ncbi:MAG: TIGR03749 family integrating conjugative element protein [Pseudomonadota bacterium]
MSPLRRSLMLLLLLGVSSTMAATDLEHVVWNKTPIKVTLPVGEERRIDFPVPVKLEVPAALAQASKPIQIREDGSVYWTANKAFKADRVKAITFTGYSYFLDVEARKGGLTHPLVILDERVPGVEDEKAQLRQRRSYDYDDVDLARYAAQNVYAPMRLIKPLPGVTRMPVPDRDYPLYRGKDLTVEPLAQWRSPTMPSRYVTALRVTSQSLTETVFDPRQLRGDWLSAAAQHPVIHPAGSDGDTTTWYLVSAHPFEETCP